MMRRHCDSATSDAHRSAITSTSAVMPTRIVQQLLAFSQTVPSRTIAQLVAQFRADQMATQKPRTLLWMEHYLHRIEREIGRMQCTRQFRSVALRWRETEAKHAAQAMTHLLGRLLRYAITLGWRFEEHDLQGLCRIESPPRTRIFSIRQRVELSKYLARPASARRRVSLDAIAFLMHTGWRASEACSLQWSWIDFEERVVYLPDTKVGPQERVIGDAAISVVLSRPKICAWVFPHRKGDGPLSYKSVSWEFSLAREALGLDGLCLHSLRHDFCTRASQLSLSPKFIACLVGHSAEWQTFRYVSPAREDLRGALDKLDAAMADRKTGSR